MRGRWFCTIFNTLKIRKIYSELLHLSDYFFSFKAISCFQLLKHYEHVEDGKALRELWNQLRNKQLPYICKSESVHLAVTKFVLNCIKTDDSYGVITSFYDCKEVLKNLCYELGVKLSELVVCNWANFKCFPRHLLDELVDKMISFHMSDSPPSAIMVQAVLDFLSKDVKHVLRDLLVLKFFRHGDKNLIKIFSLIKANQANYTPVALLHIAQKWKQNQYYSIQIKPTNLFSHDVETLITYASHRHS